MRKYALLCSLTTAALFLAARPAPASILVRGGTSPGVELTNFRVYATVHGRGAKTVVYMTFTNRGSDRRAQATMVFPVPKGAAVQRLRLKVHDKWMEGEVVGRLQGRAVYDRLYRRRIDPALLAQVGEGRYRLRVFPIPTGSSAEVEIVYWHVLTEDDGTLDYELPFDLAGVRAAAVRAPVSLSLTCRGLGRTRVKTPAGWTGAKVRTAKDSCTVDCPQRRMALSGALRVSLKPKKLPELLLARRTGGTGYFYIEARPERPAKVEFAPRRFVFCLDRSGSMGGEKIAQAREALAGCLATLRPVDQFNIVTFSGEVDTFTRKMESVAEMRKKALKFVREIEAGGSTDIRGAVLTALKLDAAGKQPLDIILISDGQQTVGASTPESVLGPVADAAALRKAPVRLSVVGIGRDVDAKLLKRLAARYEGEAAFVTAEHAVAGQIEAVLARLQAARMERVRVSIDAPGGGTLVTPAYFPSVPYGRSVVVAGAYHKPGRAKIKLTWDEGARKRTWERAFDLPARRDAYGGAPILMAAAYADALEAEITGTARESGRVRRIIVAGRRYRLVTRYTSLIALETDALYRQQGVARPERDALGIAKTVIAGDVGGERRFGTGSGADERRADDPRDSVVNPGPIAKRPMPPGGPGGGGSRRRDLFRNPLKIRADTTVNQPMVVHERPRVVRHFGGGSVAVPGGGSGTVPGVPGGATADVPLGGTGVAGAMGVGGGGMIGVYGYRDGGGRKRAVVRFGGSALTENAVDAALAWLARHQEAGGGWSKGKSEGEATGLATLAFLGAGYTSKTGKYRDNARRAAAWITSRQRADGGFKVSDADAYRVHAILTLALSEAYGMTRDAKLREMAQAAVDRALKLRKKLSGWGRRKGRAPDTVTTVWFVAALKSAKVAGLKVDAAGFQGAASYFSKVAFGKGEGFRARPGQKSPDPTASMAAVAARLFMGYRRWQMIGDARSAVARGEKLFEKLDPAYLYFGTMTNFQLGGEDWRAWNAAMKKSLLARQRKGGPRDGKTKDIDGSWDAAGPGRTRVTALGAMTLEVYYRYLPLYVR